MGKVLSVNIIWIIKNDRPNRLLSWPSLCFPSDAAEMLIAVNQGSWEDWGTGAAMNPDLRCWSQIDNNLEITAEFQLAGRPEQGQLPKRATFLSSRLTLCLPVPLFPSNFLTRFNPCRSPSESCSEFWEGCHLPWLVFIFYVHRKLWMHCSLWIPTL